MIKLEAFTKNDFEKFKSWIDNAVELYQFAGPIFKFPLTDDQLMSYIQNKDLNAFKVILKSTGENIGHCEINLEDGNHRLSRILVGEKSLRGKKIGEQMVRQMVDKLFSSPEVKEVDLNTFEWNKAAIKCYQNVGFRINPEKFEYINVNGQIWKKINLTLSREYI